MLRLAVVGLTIPLLLATALPSPRHAHAQAPSSQAQADDAFDPGLEAAIESGSEVGPMQSSPLVPEGDPGAGPSAPDAASQATGPTWRLALPDNDHAPSRFLAVDKASQTFYVLERRSPLRKIHELPCATGQVAGDKYREGDLRTPEGVYFIERTLRGGLDYQLYGDIAYTLNFPNPVDRIKGKTGYGIWIHGRGTRVEPMETRGCVALNNPDLHELGAILGRGTPVVIAQNINWPLDGQTHSGEANALMALVREWAKAWQQRSETFFSFYDPARFSRSGGEPFERFKANKERLFNRLSWIQVFIDDVTAIPGPDYWITTFEQVYRAPGITSAVRKRLYWQKDAKGVWRIVGREYDQPAPDLKERYLAHVSAQVSEAVSVWRAAWEHADLEGYGSLYLPRADQQGRGGRAAIVEHKRGLWTDNPPRRVELGKLDMRLHPRGIEVTFSQTYESANGYSDSGTKTLILEPRGDRWLIAAEHWRKGN